MLARFRLGLGRVWVIAILGAIYLVSQRTILSILEPLDPAKVLRLQLAMSAAEFVAIKQAWINAGVLDAYWHHFVFDFPHPFFYGLFSAACIAGALRFAARPASYDFLLLFPLAGAACDLVENGLHVLFLVAPRTISDVSVAISGTFTHLKWLLMGASTLSTIALVAWGLEIRIAARAR